MSNVVTRIFVTDCPHRLELVAAAGQRLRRVDPLHLQLRGRLDRVVLVLRHDADEVALAYDAGPFDVADRLLVDRHHRRAEPEHGLAARENDAPVEHPGDADVVDVGRGTGDDRRDLDARHACADERVLADRLRRRHAGLDAACEVEHARAPGRHVVAVGHPDVEELAAEQLPVRNGPAAARDDALSHRKLRCGDAELRRREAEQCLPRPGSGRSDAGPRVRDRVARRLRAGLGGHVRVGFDVHDLAELHAELFGRDLQDARDRPGSLRDRTGLDRRGVVGVDRDPGIDLVLVEGPVARERAVRRPRFAGETGEAEADDQRAASLDERLA
jgi:hypothetical protein